MTNCGSYVKTKYVYRFAAAVVLLVGCEPQGDRPEGRTNNVSPATETNTALQVNRPPASATVTNVVTNANSPRP